MDEHCSTCDLYEAFAPATCGLRNERRRPEERCADWHMRMVRLEHPAEEEDEERFDEDEDETDG